MTHVLIIGAGPAGLGAAQALAQAGAQVTVLERQMQAGGVPRLCGHSPFGLREFRRLLGGQTYARRLAAAASAAGARLILNHAVTSIEADLLVRVATPDGEVSFRPDLVLLATGAREASRAERLLPGERPLGIVTTGALQDLWVARRALPFRRPVILGSGLVAMPAILTCRQAGAAPCAVVEASAALIARAPFRWLPRTLGIPVLTSTNIEDLIARDGRLHQVVVRNGAGQTRVIDCDGLVLTGAFRPESGLARMIGLAIDPASGRRAGRIAGSGSTAPPDPLSRPRLGRAGRGRDSVKLPKASGRGRSGRRHRAGQSRRKLSGLECRDRGTPATDHRLARPSHLGRSGTDGGPDR